jgi:hypothetical protein
VITGNLIGLRDPEFCGQAIHVGQAVLKSDLAMIGNQMPKNLPMKSLTVILSRMTTLTRKL